MKTNKVIEKIKEGALPIAVTVVGVALSIIAMRKFGEQGKSIEVPYEESFPLTLRNFEVINELKDRHGIDLRSSQQLNKILESLGIIEKKGNDWLQTDFGMQFVSSRSKFFRANVWRRSIVDYIAKSIR